MTRFKIIGFWSILIFFIFSIYICISCTSEKHINKDDYTVYIDSLDLYKKTTIELNQKVYQYSVLIETQASEIRTLKDSIETLNQKPIMSETLFLQCYRYQRLKYY